MNLLLVAGQLINPDYIRRIKAHGKTSIEIKDDGSLVSQSEHYIVHLDGGEEIMITQDELNLIWNMAEVEG